MAGAAQSATDARSAKAAAETSASTATSAKTAAQTAETNAKASETAAASSKTAAATSASKAENAQSAAEDAQTAAETAASTATSAKTAAETAKTGAVSAQSKAQSAQVKAEGAAADAEESAAAAAQSATQVAANSKTAESWAVGGTGTREGEDSNNAKYWCESAQAIAGGGVTSFNGRGGIVKPQKGDYTAEMVGADASGAAAAVQSNLDGHEGDTTAHITAAERTKWNGKSGKALSFTVTLTAAGWSGNAQTVSNSKFVTSGYAYTVCPAGDSFAGYAEAVIYADDVTTAGKMTFHCNEAPTANLTVNILRTEATA